MRRWKWKDRCSLRTLTFSVVEKSDNFPYMNKNPMILFIVIIYIK